VYEFAQEEGGIQPQPLPFAHELILFFIVNTEYHSFHVHFLLFTIDNAGACACARSPLGDAYDACGSACGHAASPASHVVSAACHSGKKVCHFAPIVLYLYFSGHFDTLLLTAVTTLDGCLLSMPWF
jgi:hypothetical protein